MDEVDTSDSSWFEFFVDKRKLKLMLASPELKRNIPRLCVQFTEKAIIAERDKDIQLVKKLPPEEIVFYERKAACLWLCGLACFASIEWDFEYIIDNVSQYELLIIRALIDQTFKMYNDKKMDATFGNWLFYRWCLSLGRRFRIPMPPPKATIAHQSHQNHQADPAYQRHEKVLRMLSEFQEHVPKARLFLMELIEKPRDVPVPGVRCFVEPFFSLAGSSLSLAFSGDRDVLAVTPAPDFDIEVITLPAVDVANKCRVEILVLLFSNGEFQDAKRQLAKVVQPKSPSSLVAVDANALCGYCVALDVRVHFSRTPASKAKHNVYDEKLLSDDRSAQRSSELFRRRAEDETKGQLHLAFCAENAARCVIDGKPECVRERIATRVLVECFVKSLRRQMDFVRSFEQRTRVNAYLQYLCATTKDLRTSLAAVGYDASFLRDLAQASPKPKLIPVPTSDMIKALIQSSDPWWRILTKFKLQHLKEAMREMSTYWHPQTMGCSEFLKGIATSSVAAPNHNLQLLLLGKLDQLTKIRNYKFFSDLLPAYVKEMCLSPAIFQQRSLQAVYEAMHVQAEISNAQIFVPFERSQETKANIFLTIFTPEFQMPDHGASEMINQCLSILLNLGEFKSVLEKAANINVPTLPMVPIARLLGAYGDKFSEAVTARKCADAFSKHVTPMFVNTQPRGYRRTAEGVLVVEPATNSRAAIVQMVHLFELIRQPQLVAFLLAYMCSLYNRSHKPAHMKLYAQLLHLFGSDHASLENANVDDIRQCLRILCRKSHETSRTTASALRTYGDFFYVEGNYQQALLKYVEYFAAHSYNFRLNPSDFSVFHDTLLHRIRMCLNNGGYLTLALLMCQMMKKQKNEEIRRSSWFLRNNETRDDGANCAVFIYDTATMEALSDAYNRTRQTRSLEILYAGCSSLAAAANRNSRSDLLLLDSIQRLTRLLKTLAALSFAVHL